MGITNQFWDNIRNSNFKEAILVDALLAGAQINNGTDLPFSVEQAFGLGIVHDDIAPPQPSTTEPVPPAPVLTGNLPTLKNLFSIEVTEEIIAFYQSFSRPDISFEKDIIELLEKEDKISVENLELALLTLYYNEVKIREINAQIKKLDEDGEWREANKLKEELQNASNHRRYNNQLVNEGLKKISDDDKTLENYIKILPYLSTQRIGWEDLDADQVAEVIVEFEKMLKDQELTQDEKLQVVNLYDSIGESKKAGAFLFDLYKQNNSPSIDAIIETMKLVDGRSQSVFMKLAIDDKDFVSLTTAETFTLVDAYPDQTNSIIAAALSKISDLDLSNTLTLMDKATNSVKDNVALKYLGTVEEISTENLITISKKSYNKKNSLLLSNLAKISDGSSSNIMNLMDVATHSTKDQIGAQGINLFIPTLTTVELIAIAKKSYDKKNSLLNSNVSKVSDLTVDNLISIVTVAQYSTKDKIIILALTKLLPSYTTAELILLANNSYDKKNHIIATYNQKVSDLGAASIVKLQKVAQYSTKDKIALEYLITLKEITSNELNQLAINSYEKKNAILSNHVSKVNDLSMVNAEALIKTAKYGTKDTLINNYLASKSFTTDELIKLANLAYSKKSKILLTNAQKTSDISTANVVKVAKIVSDNTNKILLTYSQTPNLSEADTITLQANARWSTKDTIAINFLERISAVSTQAVVSLVVGCEDKKNTIATKYLAKISDLTLQNATTLINTVRWSHRDKIINFVLGKEIFTTDQLIKFANMSDENTGTIISNKAPKASDINTANIIKLAEASGKKNAILGAYVQANNLTAQEIVSLATAAQWSTKDTIIFNYLNKVLPVTATELIAMSVASYDKKNTILSKHVGQVTDLTPSNLSTIMSKATYNAKDTIAIAGLNMVSGLTTDELLSIYKNSYDKQFNITTKAMPKVTDLTTANALRLASLFSYSSKDSILLSAVQTVTDLDKENLNKLAAVAYNKKTEILQLGLDVLISQN